MVFWHWLQCYRVLRVTRWEWPVLCDSLLVGRTDTLVFSPPPFFFVTCEPHGRTLITFSGRRRGDTTSLFTASHRCPTLRQILHFAHLVDSCCMIEVEGRFSRPCDSDFGMCMGVWWPHPHHPCLASRPRPHTNHRWWCSKYPRHTPLQKSAPSAH